MNRRNANLRALPSVDLVLRAAADLVARWGHERVAKSIREELQRLRETLAASNGEHEQVEPAAIAAEVWEKLATHRGLSAVFNLSGTVLHTNLGRAVLPQSAIDAMVRVGSRASNLEYDLGSGGRGDRDTHIESLLCELCGAEAATVVNNNAAAVFLTLNTLALRREVLVSRGELVEIGGAFRMPEIIRSAGCTLVEVGTTNRTHLKDYVGGINDSTALLLKVHTSNYRIEGFTTAVDESMLAEVARRHGLPLVTDLGSGNLTKLAHVGLADEPTVQATLAKGVDVVTFSGDKLLGGPQCGIIAGRREFIDQVKTNPVKRTLRVDKLRIAALVEVLRHYQDRGRLRQMLPTMRLLTRPPDEIESQALRVIGHVAGAVPPGFSVAVVPCQSQAGSGALPIQAIPSYGLAIRASDNSDKRLCALSAAMRHLPVPVIGRIRNGEYLLDLRCLDDEEQFVSQLDGLRGIEL